MITAWRSSSIACQLRLLRLCASCASPPAARGLAADPWRSPFLPADPRHLDASARLVASGRGFAGAAVLALPTAPTLAPVAPRGVQTPATAQEWLQVGSLIRCAYCIKRLIEERSAVSAPRHSRPIISTDVPVIGRPPISANARISMVSFSFGASLAISAIYCISLPRKGCRVGLRIVLFEDCSAFTRVTACTLALSPIRDTLIEGFSHFVTSMTAPIASGWSGCRAGFAPTGKRRLVTAHTLSRPCAAFSRCKNQEFCTARNLMEISQRRVSLAFRLYPWCL